MKLVNSGRLKNEGEYKFVLVFSPFVGWHTLAFTYFEYVEAVTTAGKIKHNNEPSMLDTLLNHQGGK